MAFHVDFTVIEMFTSVNTTNDVENETSQLPCKSF